MPDFASKDHSSERRRFASSAAEALRAEVTAKMRDPELARLFSNCFLQSLENALQLGPGLGPGETPDSLGGGNISRPMSLGASTRQAWPYLSLAKEDPALKPQFAGLIHRQAASVRTLFAAAETSGSDPARESGSAKTGTGVLRGGSNGLEELCSFLRLSFKYWTATSDASCFDSRWELAVGSVLKAVAQRQAEQGEGNGEPNQSERGAGSRAFPFSPRGDEGDSSMGYEGHSIISDTGSRVVPFKRCGLSGSAFRPSGTATLFPFVVPVNAMAVVCLGQLADMLRQLKRALPLAQKADSLAGSIRDGLGLHGIVAHLAHEEILACELDGFGSHCLMDEAGIPSLLSLPYLGCCPKNDPLYQRTRSFVLSPDNPYYAEGSAGRGVGGSHLGRGWIAPGSIAMQALTSDSDEEIATCLGILKATRSQPGFIPEAFWKNDRAKITRPACAEAGSLYAELILMLHRERPHLLEGTFSRCGE